MIQRYDPQIANNFDDPYAYMDQDDYGDCVMYEEHLAVVQKLEERIALLEQSLESADGEVSDLMQTVADLNNEISYYESQPHHD